MAKNSRIQLIVSAKDKASKIFNRVRARMKSLTSSVFSLKTGLVGLGAALGGGALAKSFIDAARETENYQVRLKILLGSQKEGNRLFKEMSDYAGRVPFEYNEIMGAATQLAGILKGGVDEITQWMPLIGDLAAASGLGIRETTEQVSRMLSAGAASADLFRERGILSMLGFQAGVSYSAEETRKQLLQEWKKADSQFAGATGEMAKTWDGMMSMLSDAWFQFRQMVMESGVFDGLKAGIQGVLNKIAELKKSGRLADLAKGFGENIMSGIKTVLGALPGIVRGAIKAAEMLVLAFSGYRQLKAALEIVLAQASVWSAEFINGLRGLFLTLLQALDRIPGVDTSREQDAYSLDMRMAEINIGTLKKNVEEAKVNLGKIQIKQDETTAAFEKMAETVGSAVKDVTDGALNGMAEGHAKVAEASTKATATEVRNIDRLIEKYNQLNSVKLSGKGSFSIVSAETINRTLEDEEDK